MKIKSHEKAKGSIVYQSVVKRFQELHAGQEEESWNNRRLLLGSGVPRTEWNEALAFDNDIVKGFAKKG